MKIFKFIPLALIITLIMFISCGKKTTSSNSDWVVKIDDEVITANQFEKFYYTQNRIALNIEKKEKIDELAADPSSLNPQVQQTIIKKNFLDHLVAQKLLYNKAMKDTQIDKNELNTIIEISKMQLVGQYYLSKKLKDKISVTQEEIDKFHEKNKQRFKHLTINEADMQIRRYLSLQKFKLESNQYILSLIAESKVNKEGFKKYMEKTKKSKGNEKTGTKSDKKEIKK